ncbi:MAG: hypothetical protein FWF66_07470 [Candidatus Bathyarchaeota archaeon]|nr:hypothetical protein [Candidatus Termiticorpusculum sp.]
MQKTRMWLIAALLIAIVLTSAPLIFISGNTLTSNNNSKTVITAVDDTIANVTIDSVSPYPTLSLMHNGAEFSFIVVGGLVSVKNFCDYPYYCCCVYYPILRYVY